MPSIGSTTQVRPVLPPTRPPSSPRMPSSGRAAPMSSRSKASDAVSIAVTMSVGDDLVEATSTRSGRPVPDQVPGRTGDPLGERDQLSRLSWVTAIVQAVGGRHRAGSATDGDDPVDPAAAGSSARGGSGSSRRRTCSATGPSSPTTAGAGSSPRACAARSSTRSTSPRTKAGAVPTVAARTSGRPRPAAVCRRLGVQIVDDLHVVGDEADRHEDHSRRARRVQGREVVVDVGLEPGLGRRPGPGAEGEVPGPAGAGGRRRPPSDLGGELTVLRGVRAAARARAVVHRGRDGVRDEDQPGTRRAPLPGAAPGPHRRLRSSGRRSPGGRSRPGSGRR